MPTARFCAYARLADLNAKRFKAVSRCVDTLAVPKGDVLGEVIPSRSGCRCWLLHRVLLSRRRCSAGGCGAPDTTLRETKQRRESKPQGEPSGQRLRYYHPEPYRLRQRANTAFRAIAERFAADSALARAWPPLDAPSFDRATAAGFRVSGSGVGSGGAWPVASCTICHAS